MNRTVFQETFSRQVGQIDIAELVETMKLDWNAY